MRMGKGSGIVLTCALFMCVLCAVSCDGDGDVMCGNVVCVIVWCVWCVVCVM